MKRAVIRINLEDLKKRSEQDGNSEVYQHILEKLGGSQQSLKNNVAGDNNQTEIPATGAIEIDVPCIPKKMPTSTRRRSSRRNINLNNWEDLDESESYYGDNSSTSSFDLDFSTGIPFDCGSIDEDLDDIDLSSSCTVTTTTTMGTDSIGGSGRSSNCYSRSSNQGNSFTKFFNDRRSMLKKMKKEKAESRKKQLRMSDIEIMHSNAVDVSVSMFKNHYTDNLEPISSSDTTISSSNSSNSVKYDSNAMTNTASSSRRSFSLRNSYAPRKGNSSSGASTKNTKATTTSVRTAGNVCTLIPTNNGESTYELQSWNGSRGQINLPKPVIVHGGSIKPSDSGSSRQRKSILHHQRLPSIFET